MLQPFAIDSERLLLGAGVNQPRLSLKALRERESLYAGS